MKLVFQCGLCGLSVMSNVPKDKHLEVENVEILHYKLVTGHIDKTIHVMLVRVQVCIRFLTMPGIKTWLNY